MARVSTQEVKNILETSLGNDQISAFIISANLIVTNSLSAVGYDDNTLKEIEKWLSAHLASIRSPVISEEEIGDAKNTYQRGEVEKGLDSTFYGQHVKLLDTEGKLNGLGQRRPLLQVVHEVLDA